MSLRRVREQLKTLRADIVPGRPRRMIAVSTATEAEEVQARLGPGEDALIIITGVPRADGSLSKADTSTRCLRNPDGQKTLMTMHQR